MALVAYDNSDSSEFEDDESDNTPANVAVNQKVEVTGQKTEPSSSQVSNGEHAADQGLFNLLPQPTTKRPAVIEEDDEFLRKKETAPSTSKPKAKITVPSLSDFKDVEARPVAKPKAVNGKKSGLLSILPQPKNAGITTKTTSLVPNILTKKPLVPASVKKKETLPSPVKKAKAPSKGLVNSDESDNDDEETTDFFSIHKPIAELPIEDIPLDIDKPVQPAKKNIEIPEQRTSNIQSYFKQDVPQHVELEPDYGSSSIQENYNANVDTGYSNKYAEPESSNGEAVLDDEAIRQLLGSRGKRKREDIQIVDVNQQEVLADAREMLLKGLMDDTTKRVSASKKRGNEPTTQQRRKHQITYLAHQAKANEAELQNQWANNRMSKRQTQSKYGF